ncbi:hypothetical protein VNO78_30545 [Psophocarpus tetragonolobus]|uniref:Protein Abitram n=1 Tax=Psophocarpus tetragonolobus TaxID=3891 RepID=A0AAN9RWZ2_PSOTE
MEPFEHLLKKQHSEQGDRLDKAHDILYSLLGCMSLPLTPPNQLQNLLSPRCCVKDSLLEVNQQLIKQPELLNVSAHKEGYIAIIMPKPAYRLKIKASLVSLQEYKKLWEVS